MTRFFKASSLWKPKSPGRVGISLLACIFFLSQQTSHASDPQASTNSVSSTETFSNTYSSPAPNGGSVDSLPDSVASPGSGISENAIESSLSNNDTPQPISTSWYQRDGVKFRVGGVDIRFGLKASVKYTDNYSYSSTNTSHDIISTLTPIIQAGGGDWTNGTNNNLINNYSVNNFINTYAQNNTLVNNYFLLNYLPGFQYYAIHPSQNNLPQHLSFETQFGTRLMTTFQVHYIQTDSPLASQTGLYHYKQLDAEYANTYILGGRTSIKNEIDALYQNNGGSVINTTLTWTPSLIYQTDEKFTFLFSPYAGVLYPHDIQTQTFEGANVGFKYNTLSKFSWQGAVGVTGFQTKGEVGQSSTLATPTADVGAQYYVRNTSLGLHFVRKLEASGFVNGQLYINNEVYLNISQKIQESFKLSLYGGYQALQYQGSGAAADPRTDQFLIVEPRIEYSFLKDQAATLSIFYRRQQRTSPTSNLAYSANIIGADLTFNF